MAATISNTDSVLDSRDIIERLEELKVELEDAHEGQGDAVPFDEWLDNMAHDSQGTLQDAAIEYQALRKFADEAEGYAPDWSYGATLIHEDHFVDYCEEMVKDIGDLPRDIPGYLVIDWGATAENLKVDYTSVEFDGETYWVR